ncbi:hypothetical protein DPMN_140647 [Dreissena polymorpha]|uniref:Uncharacterized protein n=1 Tax=Dreissena polymorpha TaxID=45954 RepID=A0A9D4JKK1_DREPO|nr:hypothetical protein DPMN_140647 [Dreissena polymorpha]
MRRSKATYSFCVNPGAVETKGFGPNSSSASSSEFAAICCVATSGSGSTNRRVQ